MGAWGTSLYANDTTLDIKDFYMSLLRNETSNEEALKLTLEQFDDLIGAEEEPLLWFALSETMWQVGRMTAEIKAKALDWIDKDGYMDAWEDNSKSIEGWRKTIGKLKTKLESPMRSEKKIKKPTVPKQDLWNLGDIYAYKLHEEYSKKNGIEGKYIVVQKIGIGKSLDPVSYPEGAEPPILMQIQIYDKVFDRIPTLDELSGLKLVPFHQSLEFENIFYTNMVKEYIQFNNACVTKYTEL